MKDYATIKLHIYATHPNHKGETHKTEQRLKLELGASGFNADNSRHLYMIKLMHLATFLVK